jgi:hypothetical protein
VPTCSPDTRLSAKVYETRAFISFRRRSKVDSVHVGYRFKRGLGRSERPHSYRQYSQCPEHRRTGRQTNERTKSEAKYNPTEEGEPTLKNMQASPKVAAQFSRRKRKRKSKVGHPSPPKYLFVELFTAGKIRLRKMSRRRTSKFDDDNLNFRIRELKCTGPFPVPPAQMSVGSG